MNVPKTIKKFVGKEVVLIVVKSYVFRTNDIDFSDNFVLVKDSRNKLKINADKICYINYDSELDIHKISYKSSEMVRGTITDLDAKFIVLEILNKSLNKTYEAVFPLKCLEGFKVFNPEIGELVND